MVDGDLGGWGPLDDAELRAADTARPIPAGMRQSVWAL